MYSQDFNRALAMTKGMPEHWTQERKIGVAVNEVNRQLNIEWCSYLDMPVLWNDENLVDNEYAPEIVEMRAQCQSLATRIDKLQADKLAYLESIIQVPEEYPDWDRDEKERIDMISYMRNGQ